MTAALKARQWLEPAEAHIDVRGLMPPQPLVSILRLLASVDHGTAVVAHLDRDPVMLYPELAQIGWRAEIVPGDPGEFRLRLGRVG